MSARVVLTGAALGVAVLAVGARVVGAQRPPARESWVDTRVVALADAAARGDAAGVRSARAAGADPNAVGKHGMIPLLFAMGANNHAGMRALIASGADANAAGPPDLPLLPSAAGANDPDLLRILLDGGANPSAKNVDGEPLLHAAIYHERWSNLHTLVERGADVDATADNRETAAMLCASLRRWDEVAYLLAHGTDPRVAALSGGTLAYRVDQALSRAAGGPSEAAVRRVYESLVARGVEFPAETPDEVRKRVSGVNHSAAATGRPQ